MKCRHFLFLTAIVVLGCDQSDQISVPSCSTHLDCAPDQRCNTMTQTCETISGTLCSKNEDCPENQICDAVSKECVSPNIRLCSSDADCAPGQTCDTQLSECISKNNACSNDDDCLATQQCDKITQQCIAKETPACENGQRDADETDVDCGGPCQPCQNGKICKIDGDCISKTCIAFTCTNSDCITATAGSIEISEIFTNPKTDQKMEHSASNQQKFLELHNTTDEQIRLDNLTLTVGTTQIPLSQCIPPQIYLVIHHAGTPLEALTITGRAVENDKIDDAIPTNGNFNAELKLANTIIHAVAVPDMTDKAGISAALPPKSNRTQDDANRDQLIPHDTITAEEDGEHPYSPGLHNQAVIPQG